jgi:hypothetical protein
MVDYTTSFNKDAERPWKIKIVMDEFLTFITPDLRKHRIHRSCIKFTREGISVPDLEKAVAKTKYIKRYQRRKRGA